MNELISSIGFTFSCKYFDFRYEYKEYFRYLYKEFKIDLYDDHYEFYNGSNWNKYALNDLTPLKKEFEREIRSFKLKQILNE